MNNRFLPLVFSVVLMLTVFSSVLPTSFGITDAGHYVIAAIGGPQTVDPALAYDTASDELIFNVYETLIDFKGASTGEFMPELATTWTISAEGTRYTFEIRQDVQWQNASYGYLTPEDVEYSFERVMVRNYAGGPAWMFFEPIFGIYAANMTDPVVMGQAIDAAVGSNATHVWVQFATGHAYAPFMSILALPWSSVLSKAWATDHGDWPGTGLQDGSWAAYHQSAQSPLDGPPNVMMGTGPYVFDYWTHDVEWSIVKFDDYWGGWGNLRRGYAARGYLTRVTQRFVFDWPTRYTGFTGSTPIYDSIYVPRAYISQVWQQPGVRCVYPLTAISVDAMFFNYNTTRLSPYIGAGTEPTFTFGETGIRPDFFSDVHVRKAVAYSFDWTTFISTAYMGEAKQNAIPVPDTFKFFDDSLPKYGINLTRAVEEWKLAWGGQVWTNGFKFAIAYNIGSTRHTAVGMIKASLESQNPKFHVDVVGIPWSTYINYLFYPPASYRSIMPLFTLGWLADYPDVHDFAQPFMTSWGDFAGAQNIDADPNSGEVDDLIMWGLRNTTDAGRKSNYDRLWRLYIQQVPSVPMVQGISRRWERDWVQGWYYNPIYPGSLGPGSNYYVMWKEELPVEDVDDNGKVDIKDLAVAAKAFGAYYIQPNLPPNPVGPAGTYSSNWNSRVDLNQDMKVDIKDLAEIAKLYGFVADPWQPPP